MVERFQYENLSATASRDDRMGAPNFPYLNISHLERISTVATLRFVLDDVTFRWMDGIFGLALSPIDKETGDRTMFFHPMASFREFAVQTSVIRNETFANANPEEFKIVSSSAQARPRPLNLAVVKAHGDEEAGASAESRAASSDPWRDRLEAHANVPRSVLP